MTRYPFSELRVNKFKMEDGKERHVKRSEAIEISCGDGKKENRGESLQEAFKKFRKDRQVFIKQTDMNYLMRKYLGIYSDRSTAGRRLCRNFIYPASRGPSIFLGKSSRLIWEDQRASARRVNFILLARLSQGIS